MAMQWNFTDSLKKDFTDLSARLYVNHNLVVENGIWWIVEKSMEKKVHGVGAISRTEALYSILPTLVYDRNNFTSAFIL